MENTLLVSNVCRLIRLHLTVRRPETDVKKFHEGKIDRASDIHQLK